MRVLLVPHTEFVAKYGQNLFFAVFPFLVTYSGVDSGVAGDVRAPPEFWGSEKGQSLMSAYRSLAITTNTPGFKKLSTSLLGPWFMQTSQLQF